MHTSQRSYIASSPRELTNVVSACANNSLANERKSFAIPQEQLMKPIKHVRV